MSRTINTMPLEQQFQEGKEWYNISGDFPKMKKFLKRNYRRKSRQVSRKMCKNFCDWDTFTTLESTRGGRNTILWDMC